MSEYIMPVRKQESNKGTFGRVINFAGSKNYIGASYLSTVSVLRAGAGLVALSSEKDIIRSVSALLPEAVYLSRTQGLKDLNKYSVCIIGCGLGLNFSAFNLFKKVIKATLKQNIPTVIDADGLNILAKTNFKLNGNFIITPHPLEKVLSDLEGSAKKLAEKYNCIVVLKNHKTIICTKENIHINLHGNSALAKAGTGDVLAGIIAGLLAQKMNPFEAAKLGVYLHSRTGEILSEEFSEYSILASDLPKYLHKAIKEIL